MHNTQMFAYHINEISIIPKMLVVYENNLHTFIYKTQI